ncbi:MAG: acyltransferase [Chitinophagaceae bacterium]
MSNQKIHFKGLNGLRAIAAFSVVFSHTGLSMDHFGGTQTGGLTLASYGVTIFFSLSGFLITYLLLAEKDRFQSVDIRKFYLRRILRIWPLYFLYLFLALGITYLYTPSLIGANTGWYFFLGANFPYILGTGIPLLLHYWSLAVEEQFYLFWPLVIKKSKNAFRSVLIFFILFFLVKLLARVYQSQTGDIIPYFFLEVTRFDCMAIGALGAILYFKKNALFLKGCFLLPVQILTWGLLILIAFERFHITSMIDDTIVAIATVVMIMNVSCNPKSLVKLGNKVFDYLGKISFGIYVYHPLVIFLLTLVAKNIFKGVSQAASFLLAFLLISASTILVASLSYKYFEKRFLVIKTKYSKVHSEA